MAEDHIVNKDELEPPVASAQALFPSWIALRHFPETLSKPSAVSFLGIWYWHRRQNTPLMTLQVNTRGAFPHFPDVNPRNQSPAYCKSVISQGSPHSPSFSTPMFRHEDRSSLLVNPDPSSLQRLSDNCFSTCRAWKSAIATEVYFRCIKFSHSPSSIFKNIYLIKFISEKLSNITELGKGMKRKNGPFIQLFSAASPELGDLAELCWNAMQ